MGTTRGLRKAFPTKSTISTRGFPKMVVPNNHGVFLLKIIILGCFGGTTILWKHPLGCGKPHLHWHPRDPYGQRTYTSSSLGMVNPQTHLDIPHSSTGTQAPGDPWIFPLSVLRFLLLPNHGLEISPAHSLWFQRSTTVQCIWTYGLSWLQFEMVNLIHPSLFFLYLGGFSPVEKY